MFAAPVLSAQNVKERFTGFAINMNGAANTATVDFTIERWSTDAERKKLLSLIPEEHKSPQKLVSALQDMKSVGSIRTPQTLAWDLRYARQFKMDEGGRRIVLVTDRPIGFRRGRATRTRSMDYPFTILEIRLNAKDEGEGKIFGGSKSTSRRASWWSRTGARSPPASTTSRSRSSAASGRRGSEGFLDRQVDPPRPVLADADVETQVGLRPLVDQQAEPGAAADRDAVEQPLVLLRGC